MNDGPYRNSQLIEDQRMGMLSHEWDIYITLFCKAQGPSQESGWKKFKSQRSGKTSAKQCVLDRTGLGTHELTAAVVACTRPTQDEASQHSGL